MLKKIYYYFLSDSLYKNSIYLMASTLVMATLGFFFWLINAQLFTPEEIGLATTLISTMTLISIFSLLGLDAGIIRYLPKSKRKNDKINTCFIIVSLVAALISIIFIFGLKRFSPQLTFLKKNLLYSSFFLLSMVFAANSVFIESIFIAFRETKFVLFKNTLFSILKLLLPFLLISLGTMGIFASWTIALTIGFLTTLAILKLKFDYQPKFIVNQEIIKKISRFSFGNYLAGFLNTLPATALPLIITNLASAETTAYFYMPMMIANLLFIIPLATAQSLFAEGSYSEKEIKNHLVKAIKIILLTLTPVTLITIFFGKYILLAFGKDYQTEGLGFLQLLCLSGIFISVNRIFEAFLKIKKQIKKLILANFTGAFFILVLSYLFISQSLFGIGLAWLIGQAITSLLYLTSTLLYKK